MIDSQDTKLELVISPGTTTLATNSTTYGYLDTLGWDYATILYITNKFATTSACAKTLLLTEGTNSTAASGIVAFTGGTSVVAGSTGFVIPAYKGTSEGTIVRLNVDLRKRERYLRAKIAPGKADNPYVIAILSRGREAIPGSDAGSVALDVTG